MFLISEVRLYTSWLSMVSRLMEGRKGTSSTAANSGDAATFFVSITSGVFNSGWLAGAVTVTVTVSGTGTSTVSGFGSGSGNGCALSEKENAAKLSQ